MVPGSRGIRLNNRRGDRSSVAFLSAQSFGYPRASARRQLSQHWTEPLTEHLVFEQQGCLAQHKATKQQPPDWPPCHCCCSLLPQLASACQARRVPACHGLAATPRHLSHTTQPALPPAPTVTSAAAQAAQLRQPASARSAALGSGWSPAPVLRHHPWFQVRAVEGDYCCCVRCTLYLLGSRHVASTGSCNAAKVV